MLDFLQVARRDDSGMPLRSEQEIESLRASLWNLSWGRKVTLLLTDGRKVSGDFWGVTPDAVNLRDGPSIGLARIKEVGIQIGTDGPE